MMQDPLLQPRMMSLESPDNTFEVESQQHSEHREAAYDWTGECESLYHKKTK